jgi:uncharacterized protein YndB with AHSA1/START domain
MVEIDVTDEAVIEAPPIEVYKAVLDMYAGNAKWSPPSTIYKLRGDATTVSEGSIVDMTIHGGRGVTFKVSGKFTKIEEAKLIEEEVSGAFIGTGTWTFEPTTKGKTKLQYRFNARTNKLLFSVLSPFVNIGKKHSDMMQKEFKACNSYLCKK